jgi:hypothetical protein
MLPSNWSIRHNIYYVQLTVMFTCFIIQHLNCYVFKQLCNSPPPTHTHIAVNFMSEFRILECRSENRKTLRVIIAFSWYSGTVESPNVPPPATTFSNATMRASCSIKTSPCNIEIKCHPLQAQVFIIIRLVFVLLISWCIIGYAVERYVSMNHISVTMNGHDYGNSNLALQDKQSVLGYQSKVPIIC